MSKSAKNREEEQRKVLENRKTACLNRIVELGWIFSYFFTPKCGILDARGFDLEISFKPHDDGVTGCLDVQEKTRTSGIRTHFLRHPCVPAYLLKLGDSERQIEYVYLQMILLCRAYNYQKKEEIESKLKQLEAGETVDKHQKRVWLSWIERCPE